MIFFKDGTIRHDYMGLHYGTDTVVLGHEKQKIKKNGAILEQKWVQVYTVENGLITRMEEYANTDAAGEAF